jgi:hypothetical protein
MRSKPIVLALAFSMSVVAIARSADETAAPSAAPAAAKAPAKETTAEPDADEKALLGRGYKKEVHNGQTVYCRKEIKTGSHFETKQCGTAASMALAEQQARDLMHNSQFSSGSKSN